MYTSGEPASTRSQYVTAAYSCCRPTVGCGVRLVAVECVGDGNGVRPPVVVAALSVDGVGEWVRWRDEERDDEQRETPRLSDSGVGGMQVARKTAAGRGTAEAVAKLAERGEGARAGVTGALESGVWQMV